MGAEAPASQARPGSKSKHAWVSMNGSESPLVVVQSGPEVSQAINDGKVADDVNGKVEQA